MAKYFFNTQIQSSKYYFNTIQQAYRFNTHLAPSKYFFNTVSTLPISDGIVINPNLVGSGSKYVAYFNTILQSSKYYFNVELVGKITDITNEKIIVSQRSLEELEEMVIDGFNESKDDILELFDSVTYYSKLGRKCIRENENLLAYAILFDYLIMVKGLLLDNKKYSIYHSQFFYKDLFRLDEIKLWFTKRNLPIQHILDAFDIENYIIEYNSYPKLDSIFGNDEGIFEGIFE